MQKSSRYRPTPSMAVAIAALVIAASGTALAAATSGDSLIKPHSLSGNRLRNHTLTGTQIDLTKLGVVPRAKLANTATLARTATVANAVKNVTIVKATVLTPTDGADFATAESNAPAKTLFTRAPFTIYAKCFRDTGAGKLYSEVFIKTTQAGSMYDSDDAPADGNATTVPTLNPSDAEQSRIIVDEDGPALANAFSHADPDYTQFWAAAPNGLTLQGSFDSFAANGTVANLPAQMGTGNKCLVMGRVFG